MVWKKNKTDKKNPEKIGASEWVTAILIQKIFSQDVPQRKSSFNKQVIRFMRNLPKNRAILLHEPRLKEIEWKIMHATCPIGRNNGSESSLC